MYACAFVNRAAYCCTNIALTSAKSRQRIPYQYFSSYSMCEEEEILYISESSQEEASNSSRALLCCSPQSSSSELETEISCQFPTLVQAQETSSVNSLLYRGVEHTSPLTQHLLQLFFFQAPTQLPGLGHTCMLKHPEHTLTHLHTHLAPKQRVLPPLTPCQHRLLSPAPTTAIIFPIEVSCKQPPTFFMHQHSSQTAS